MPTMTNISYGLMYVLDELIVFDELHTKTERANCIGLALLYLSDIEIPFKDIKGLDLYKSIKDILTNALALKDAIQLENVYQAESMVSNLISHYL